MVKLKRPVIESGAIGIDIGMLADGCDTFDFIRVGRVCHKDFHVRIANGDIVHMAGQGAIERRLANERGPAMEQDREVMKRCIFPQVVELPVAGSRLAYTGRSMMPFSFRSRLPPDIIVLPGS